VDTFNLLILRVFLYELSQLEGDGMMRFIPLIVEIDLLKKFVQRPVSHYPTRIPHAFGKRMQPVLPTFSVVN
jgi:hypothetical protein